MFEIDNVHLSSLQNILIALSFTWFFGQTGEKAVFIAFCPFFRKIHSTVCSEIHHGHFGAKNNVDWSNRLLKLDPSLRPCLDVKITCLSLKKTSLRAGKKENSHFCSIYSVVDWPISKFGNLVIYDILHWDQSSRINRE